MQNESAHSPQLLWSLSVLLAAELKPVDPPSTVLRLPLSVLDGRSDGLRLLGSAYCLDATGNFLRDMLAALHEPGAKSQR